VVEKAKATPKLDIFRVLNALNERDINFFAKLTEEEQKAFQPFLVQRWMSGTSDARQVYFINALANPYVFTLPNHKQLLWYLLVVANSGKSQRYVWNKLPAGSTSPKPLSTKIVAQYFNYSMKEAGEAVHALSKNDILNIAVDLGMQPDELSKIKKEHSDDKSEWVDTSKPTTSKNAGLIEF
jgi:hypothetical protein